MADGETAGSGQKSETNEILWQGIPWGSSPEEATAILLDKGFLASEIYGTPTEEWIEVALWDGSGTYLVPAGSSSIVSIDWGTDYETVLSRISFDKDQILQKIAGYTVKRVGLTFANTSQGRQLIAIDIKLDILNADEAYEDLSNKLSSVYVKGKRKEEKSWGFFENVWRGDNNSVVTIKICLASSTSTMAP